MDISLYSSGIICGDLVGRMAMVLDYSRKRIGVPKSLCQTIIHEKGDKTF